MGNIVTSAMMLELTKNMPMKQIDIDGVPQLYRGNVPDNAVDIAKIGPLPMYAFKIPYLQRYYAGTFRDGKDLWLHRFLRNDGDRHLHCHPYNFTTVMLCGGYTEEYRNNEGINEWRTTKPHNGSDIAEILPDYLQNLAKFKGFDSHLAASYNFIGHCGGGRDITVFDWHRIAVVEPETWTAMIVDPQRMPMWFFNDDNNNLEAMRGSPRDWHKKYGARDEKK